MLRWPGPVLHDTAWPSWVQPVLSAAHAVHYTMTLRSEVSACFSADGPLARAWPSFVTRSGQQAMAEEVARTVDQGGCLVVEAGTGIGKTFAYLVPALLSGRRTLVSTATKTLQDQLFARDLPRLLQALALPVRVALLKGRGNYLCLQRLQMARQDDGLLSTRDMRALARIEQWSQQSRSGDMTELPGLDERSPLLPLVTSTRDNCLGSNCPQWRSCHVQLARRQAMDADVVVINHHLFFADWQVRESGMAELLPAVHTVIVDEAHQLNEIGVQFLSDQVGTAQWLDLSQDLLATGQTHARGLADWVALSTQLEHDARDLRLVAGRRQGRVAWLSEAPEGVDGDSWNQALEMLMRGVQTVGEVLDPITGMAPELERLRERCRSLQARVQTLRSPTPVGCVRWLECGAHLRLLQAPLDIATALRARVWPDGEGSDRKAWIFTSATLGEDASVRWFTEPCGLDDARVLRIASPYDYRQQAGLYVPRALPRPADPGHSQAVAKWVAQQASSLGGRTLVLTTSLRALQVIGAALSTLLAEHGITVLAQGQMPKRELLARFAQGGGDKHRYVLVGSASFWEGVDIAGDALQLVVIDKLPFPVPSDPLVEARTRRMESQGRSVFAEYFLPETAVALKQGAGRLIRSERDRGLLVVCDTRLRDQAYGRRLLSALPPMVQLADENAWSAAMVALTRASTTDG